MKKICLLLILASVMQFGFSQKVDLDKFYFTASYRDLPRKGLDPSYNTFNVKMDAGFITKLAFNNEKLEQQITIDGWRRLPFDGHVQIQLQLEDVMILNTEVKEKVNITKDKNGVEIGRKSTYTLQVYYSFGAKARLTDYNGWDIQSIILSDREQKQIHNSESFPTAADANAYFKYGIFVLTNQLVKQSVQNAIINLNSILTASYGYPERTVNDFFWIVGSKKHPEYEDHRRAWATFRQVILQMSPDESLDAVKEQMKPVMLYFNSIKKKYASNSKWDKKLRYASYFNLAKIHWYLDDPDAAMKEATELVINGYDSKDGKRLENGAVDLKTQMRQAKMTTRHFPVRVNEFQGPFAGNN